MAAERLADNTYALMPLLPLLPLQILWINLATDGLPGLALALEPKERDIMQRPSYDPRENIFSRGMGRHIVWVGLLMGLVPLEHGHAIVSTWAAHTETVWRVVNEWGAHCHVFPWPWWI